MDPEKEKSLLETAERFYTAPISEMIEFCAEDLIVFGTTPDEKTFTLNEMMDYRERVKVTSKNVKRKIERKLIQYRITSGGNGAFLTYESKQVFIKDEIKIVLHGRNTMVLEYNGNKWLIVHVHFARVNAEQEENDPFHFSEVKQKNKELQKLVNEKTADLEEKNKELQIENSLERVRAKAMAMHCTDDLSGSISVFFKEMKSHGVIPWQCGVGRIDEATKTTYLTTTSFSEDGNSSEVSGILKLEGHPVLDKIFESWKLQREYYPVLNEDEVEDYYKVVNPQISYPEYPHETQYGHMFFFKEGFIFAWTENKVPENELNIFRRFSSVLSLAYRRYLDLKEAEAQRYKARIETALERVRARALAMQEPEELMEVAKVLRYEMGLLEMEELQTCRILIHDKSSDKADCWFALKKKYSEKEIISDHIITDLSVTQAGRDILKFLNSGKENDSIPMKGEVRKEWMNYCSNLSAILKETDREDYTEVIYHLHKFSNGAIATSSPGNISEESLELLKRVAAVFSLAYSRFKDLMQARKDLLLLKEEKKRSDSLLLNILPEDIAAELKQFGKSYARKHDEVTIMFADIKGFTAIAEELEVQELITQLDECFRAFDYIVEKHGLEKIKTIGDAYVCVCGLPKPVDDNAARTIRAAIDMREFVKGFGMTNKIQGLPAFEIRIGIHTGPVITGVVGLKKFTYDIWGDAVNIAARMEQHGETGKINISDSVYQLVKDNFKCVPRGEIEAKNKGKLKMYFVESVNKD